MADDYKTLMDSLFGGLSSSQPGAGANFINLLNENREYKVRVERFNLSDENSRNKYASLLERTFQEPNKYYLVWEERKFLENGNLLVYLCVVEVCEKSG